MDRRTFNKLAGLTAAGALTNAELRAEQPNSAGEVVLEDDVFQVAFDAVSGALTRLVRKSTNWVIERRPELGASFRLLVPLPHQRANFVLGQKQRAVSVRKISDNQVRLEWNNLVSEHGGMLPIAFTAVVTLQDGALTFDATLKNNSPLWVETIDYPYFGDLNGPTREEQLQSEVMWYGNLEGKEIHPRFDNEKGYWGVRYPTKTSQSDHSLYCLIQAASQGLYVEMHDPTQPYLLEYTFEQHPGIVAEDRVPEQDEISGLTVNLEFRTCHFVFAHPKSTRKLAPVLMRGYDGDWHAGLDIYKQWRATWFKRPHIAAWVEDVHSWLQLQIDGAEQDFSILYRELPKYIDECAANGVTAIQLVGWALGGQDGGDPCLDTDPGLGTWLELHQAILHARRKGVKIVLFGKPIWADMTTEWYKKELYKYDAIDPYGIPYETGGYSYTTPTQLAGINNRRRAIMDVQCQAYRDIATHEFEKTVALGADGWLFDEVCHHAGVLYSFSAGRGYEPPSYIYGGDMPMAAQFRAAADKVNPDFIFAGEGPQDWLMQYYPVSYFRINDGSRPVCRYIDSQAPLLVAVTGIDDREKLNLILLNRYIISYEPFNFKGHVTDFPLTLVYGKKIDALRRRYREYLWDAEFRDTLGASVTGSGSVRHAVFVAKSGKRAVVVVNPETTGELTVKIDLPHAGRLVVVTPEQPEMQAVSDMLKVPARSAAVIMEP
ncbi:MAG TPA: hypothetical protein VHX20_11775 [Terracidiphilus sp.]|jgi:hypothetical protein|nr:hypothetical protein [Terracidiphilus sp.]